MGKRIYCGNLSFKATEDEIRSLFSQHGEVTDVHLVIDRETGRSRGFAFVEMATDEQAKAAITALDGFRHQDRNLKVNEAQPREERGGGGGVAVAAAAATAAAVAATAAAAAVRGGGGGGHGGTGRRRGVAAAAATSRTAPLRTFPDGPAGVPRRAPFVPCRGNRGPTGTRRGLGG